MPSKRIRAFTLIELLVVISIIGLLMALILPAVNSARERARATACLNNIRSVATGVLAYAGAHNMDLPHGSVWKPGINIETANNKDLSENWMIKTLPYLDGGQMIRDSFDLTKPITDPANQKARSTRIEFLLCPSDSPYNTNPYMGSRYTQGDNWARGNYAANSALGYMTTSKNSGAPGGIGDAGGPTAKGWISKMGRGLMGANTSVNLDNMRDQKSATVLLGEVRAGVNEIDARGTWAMSGSPSSLWAHGSIGTDNGPNSSNPKGDGVNGCSDLQGMLGGDVALAGRGMPCTTGHSNDQQTMRSQHGTGVHVAFADGSAKYLSDSIQTGNDPANPSVWDRINLSDDQDMNGSNTKRAPLNAEDF